MKLALIISLVAGSGLLLGCSQSPPTNSNTPVKIDGLQTSMYRIERIADHYEVYQSENTSANHKLDSYAARLGITGSRTEKGETTGVQGDSGAVFVNKRTGVVQFSFPNEGVPGVASEDADARVAEAFLRSLGLAGGNLKLQEVSTRMVARYNLMNNEAAPEEIEQRDYSFRRLIKGTAAYGPGTKVVVSVGRGSKVVGGHIDLPEIKATKTVRLKDAAIAVQDLDAALNRINGTIRESRHRMIRMRTKGIKVRYVSQPAPEGGLVLRPSYAVLGDATRRDASAQNDIAVFVSASDEAPLLTTAPTIQAPAGVPGANPHS